MEKSQTAAAPPSYDESQNHQTYPPTQAGAGGAGGFAAPQAPMDTKGQIPGAVPPNIYPSVPPAGTTAYVPAGAALPPGTQQVVVVVNPPNYGPNPIDMVCPHCQSQVRTTTESEPGPLAWIFAGILCVVGLWPCACVPCCIESLNSVTHKCPNCKNFLGRYKGGL